MKQRGFTLVEILVALAVVAITLSATVTESLPVRACVYDLFMTSPAGIRTQLLKGSVLVSMRITRG
jgi:prepilin-type N-terminal cleavage/methylation domain-containing protein